MFTRVCDACPTVSCISNSSSSKSSGGVSGGAIAGGVIGTLIFLGIAVALLLWHRRRQRNASQAADAPKVEVKSDVPARAEAVLSRPDPVEKTRSPSPQEPESVRMYSVMSDSTINLDPQASSSGGTKLSRQGSVQSNPFTDTHSIQTTSASTQSTNVIPIALVPHGSVSSPHSPSSDQQSSFSSAPSRPAHSPSLGLHFDPLSSGLNLEHVNVSKDSFRPPNVPYAHSQVSGISGISNRDSVMTSGSFASDIIFEAPQIVTSVGVHVAKAEVVSVNGSIPSPPTTSSTLKPTPSMRSTKSLAKSPLAKSSFGPEDTLGELDAEGQDVFLRHDPFSDDHTPRTGSTFGPVPSTASPRRQYQHEQNDDNTRPISTYTQAASIIGAEIGGATVVRLASARSQGSMNNRMTSAKLVSPANASFRSQDDRVLQEQQAQALAAARARAAASGLPMPPNPRRVSEASVASAGADSLLESFTFVPPSPISNRPPRSPLAQSMTGTKPGSPLAQPQENLDSQSVRQSAISTASALEGYTFHIDQGQGSGEVTTPVPPLPADSGSKPPPSAMANRKRASLDTLALTADLSAFPLNFDEGRQSFSVSR